MGKSKILIIEDEVKIARFLELELKYEGYQVEIAHDGREGLNLAINNEYDVIVLDVMLPSLNGMEVLRRIRAVSNVSIIMLTAKSDVTDKVMGLDIGADDYMTKPFAIEELLARIRVMLKRNKSHSIVKDENIITLGKLSIDIGRYLVTFNGEHIEELLARIRVMLKRNKSHSIVKDENIITLGKLSIDIGRYLVTFNGEHIELTKKEFDLLKYMLDNKGIVITRDNILQNIWGYDYIGDTNVVDVYIRYLRSKIDNRFDIKLIHTVRGVGYQIKDE